MNLYHSDRVNHAREVKPILRLQIKGSQSILNSNCCSIYSSFYAQPAFAGTYLSHLPLMYIAFCPNILLLSSLQMLIILKAPTSALYIIALLVKPH